MWGGQEWEKWGAGKLPRDEGKEGKGHQEVGLGNSLPTAQDSPRDRNVFVSGFSHSLA